MANSPSARKRVRSAARRTEINKARRSRVRTYIRKVEEAIASGDQDAARDALRQAQPEIMRGAGKGIMHAEMPHQNPDGSANVGLQLWVDLPEKLKKVDPRYRSGYKIVVGNSRFVSAVGTLLVDGSPAELWSGTITAVDDDGFKAMPFFTNSRGRFGIIGLAPGKTYRVSIRREDREFEIAVPEDNTGLLRLEEVNLPAIGN